MNTAQGSGTATRPFGCYTQEQLGALHTRTADIPMIKEEFERQRQLSDQFAAREAASGLHRLGAYRVEPFVFRTPADAAYVRLAVLIQGEGEARIGGLTFQHSGLGLPVKLANGSFTDGLEGWQAEAGEGSLVCLEGMAPGQEALVASGANPAAQTAADAEPHCVFIANRRPADVTALRYEQAVPVRPGEHYSVQTALSLDAPLSGGIWAEVTFLDPAGQPLGTALPDKPFNRPTLTNWSYLLEAAGADANLFMVQQELEYAVRAARKLAYMLQDMLQGMELFRRDGWHDDDTYGAVHIGRGLAVTSVIYDQIAGSGVLPSAGQEEMLARFRHIAGIMMDTRYYRFDAESWPDEKGGKRSNWNADRATGLGVYALLFPQEARSGELLEHALSVINWQLREVVDADGAWPENIRYHGAVLHRYFLFFALLSRLKGIDYFAHDKVKAMYRFLVGTSTVADALQPGPDGWPRLLTPAVGDANVQEQWFRLLGYAAPFYADEDPQLAGEMIWAWKRGGSPVRDNGAYPFPLAALLYPQPELPECKPERSSVHYPGIGYVIFREEPSPEQGHYAIYEASPLTYHAHHDEGHFSIWADGVPVTLDAGTGGYYNGDRHWYVSGRAHNVVQFAGADGQFRNGPLQSECREVFFSARADYARSRIPDAGAQEYERHFLFVKAGFEVYLVWDRIRGGADSVWNLHTLSTGADIDVQRIEAACLGGMRLDVHIAEPAAPVITAGEGAVAGGYPLGTQQHFTISGQAGSDYVILLQPRAADRPPVSITLPDCGPLPEGVRLYEVTGRDGARLILALNGSGQAALIRVPGGGTAEPLIGTGAAVPGAGEWLLLPGELQAFILNSTNQEE
ncbi:heparinase II/III domain-containing protein [Paenibacillus tengchongensis]|uniref:heparinase II/III domain-containing protein n=1 Tax=Paenibacillus tengchongensis TaxID=2608684 RepID=UPI00124DDF58|nr:heparinase II/III family protein [Paenibacillus tengchongensis]